MATAASPAQSLAAHLITQTLDSISLLESLALITVPDANLMRSKLPLPAGPFPSLSPHAAQQPQHDHSAAFGGAPVGHSNPYDQQIRNPQQGAALSPHPILPPRSRLGPSDTRGKALWDYGGSEADDLAFRAGDTVIIDEEINEQWYRGRVIPQGQAYPLERAGLFPSNYVEKLSTPGSSPSYLPQLPHPNGPNAMIPYQTPQQASSYGYNSKPEMNGQMLIHPAQHIMLPQQSGAMLNPQDPKKHKYGKIGSQLGNAAVNGLGFGAGAAVAGDIVHALF